ncbi:major facilitator superfamily protein [Striga asiatica]|uniref:Major facilitator superfamily protein n=1 Tax=Striga asiatica TaxID=4170 RepID=A0A5A7PZQ7_STRAF|nr:major facilitator superfamily protein [Striga asiatica]
MPGDKAKSKELLNKLVAKQKGTAFTGGYRRYTPEENPQNAYLYRQQKQKEDAKKKVRSELIKELEIRMEEAEYRHTSEVVCYFPVIVPLAKDALVKFLTVLLELRDPFPHN